MNVPIRWSSAIVVIGFVAATAHAAHAQPSSLTFHSVRSFELDRAPVATESTNTIQSDTGGVSVGVLGGWTRPSFRGEDIEGLFDTQNGFMLGGWVGGNRNGRVGFVGEFIYVFRKADTALGELKYPAVEVPAVFHINFGNLDQEGVLGYVLVGPVFTLNLKQKLNGVDVDDDEGFRGADIGVMAGGGVEFYHVATEVRGNWGLRNINSEGDVLEIKTRAVEAVLKLRF